MRSAQCAFGSKAGKRYYCGFVFFCAAVVFIKTLFISAAYPIFSPVDEAEHYDVVHKYARGYLPQKDDIFDPEPYLLFLVKGTREYVLNKEQLANDTRDYFSNMADFPKNLKEQILKKHTTKSGEGGQPPVYYVLLSCIMRMAAKMGLYDEDIVYTLRFFNAIILALLIVAASHFLGSYFHENTFLRFGVPLMILFVPQDAFFQIGNDVLSPLVFLISCHFLFRIAMRREVSLAYVTIGGIVTALTFLTKYTNVVIYFVMLAAIYSRVRLIKENRSVKEGLLIAVLLISGIVPPLLWVARNYMVFGDMTGLADRVAMLGWTKKPLTAWFSHPLFYSNGFFVFFKGVVANYWRGELFWHGAQVASPVADAFYIISTACCLGASAAVMFRGKKRYLNGTLFCIIILFALQLIYLSVSFDFGNSHAPSKEYPYFTAARLIYGGFVPFAILYLKGFQFLIARIGIRRTSYQLLLFLMIMIAVNAIEFCINIPAFTGQRNWFFFHQAAKTL